MSHIAHASRAILLALFLILIYAVPAGAATYSDADCAGAAQQWANDPCAANQWGIPSIDAPGAWATSKGAGSVVAVVDTGSDFGHPDLAPNLISAAGSDIIQNTAYRCSFQSAPGNAKTSNAIAQDDNGHGTHVAGTIAAVTNNGQGVAGVAPDAKILPVKVLDAAGSGDDADVARGICFAVEHGAQAVNLSLGYDPASSIIVSGAGSDTAQAIDYAVANNVAVIAASGNEGFPACDFPASQTNTLCVGSVDRRDLKSWFSNFGSNVGVVAPGGLGSVFCEDGEDVYSTIWPQSQYDCGGNGYESLSGTSMATPHVAGVAALVISRAGGKVSPTALYERLKSTATDLGVPGNDPIYGYGKVNAAAATGAAPLTPVAATTGSEPPAGDEPAATTPGKSCSPKKSTKRKAKSKNTKRKTKPASKRVAKARARARAKAKREAKKDRSDKTQRSTTKPPHCG